MNKPFDIDYLVDEVVSLPSLPSTVAHIMRLVEDPNCPLVDVAKAISSDPPLALKTLRLVNTAYYGLRQKVNTIEHAVVLLGVKVIKNLAFTATVFDIMKGGMESFFRHSVTCGVALQSMTRSFEGKFPVDSPEEAFVFGLLHDIGKVLFEEFLPKEYGMVADACKNRQVPWYVAEREIIGVDHALLGARLAQKWKLPDTFTAAIQGHHDLSGCNTPSDQTLASMIAVADYIVCKCGVSVHPNPAMDLDARVWDLAGVSSTDVPKIMDDFFGALPMAAELMQNVS